MPPKSLRKEPSGAEKLKKKKRIEELVKSQENDIFRYFKKPETPDEFAGTSDEQHDIARDDGVDENMVEKQREETVYEKENLNAVNEENLDKTDYEKDDDCCRCRHADVRRSFCSGRGQERS